MHELGKHVALICAALAIFHASPLAADGRRQHHFEYVDESDRLPADPTPPGTTTFDVDLVDVDADGDLDLFIANGTDSLEGRPNRLLINDGRGVFADESALRLPARVDNSAKTDFGDLDGDGDIDAIVANIGPEQLLLNDGTGRFAPHPERLPPPRPLMEDISVDAHLADVDGDGDLDILVGNENPFDPDPNHGTQNRLLLNDGSARFVDATDRLPAATDQTNAIVSGDLDRDGDLDLVVINRGQDRVLINDGSGRFSDQTATRFPVSDDVSRSGALADLDGDGDLDLFVVNSRGQPIAVYRNQRRGVFKPVRQNITPLADETDTALVLADLDHDGDLDAYVANAGPTEAAHGFLGGPDRYLENKGHAKFKDATDRHFWPPSDPSTDAAFGDIDGDCDLDLVVGNSDEDGGERIFIRVDD